MEGDATAPACRLDESGVRDQLDRYQRISAHTESIERGPRRVVARFDADLPTEPLLHALEIERRCCPFIATDYDPADRRLTLTVRDPGEDQALDVLFDALRPRG
jgi:hypothetical protein